MSGCFGFSSRFRSRGVTVEGTTRTAVRPSFNHAVPMSFNSAGAGTAFQLGGKADSGSSVTGTSSGNDARIEIRSPGAVCAETCTNISRTASERCSDVYIIGYPLWFHRPPASWAPMPLNAVASCFARHSRHSSMASCTPRSRFDGGHRARPQSRWLCPGGR